jgi:hypothetical protein
MMELFQFVLLQIDDEWRLSADSGNCGFDRDRRFLRQLRADAIRQGYKYPSLRI